MADIPETVLLTKDEQAFAKVLDIHFGDDPIQREMLLLTSRRLLVNRISEMSRMHENQIAFYRKRITMMEAKVEEAREGHRRLFTEKQDIEDELIALREAEAGYVKYSATPRGR